MTARRSGGRTGLRNDAIDIWKAGVAAVEAGRLVHKALRVKGNRLISGETEIDLAAVRRIVVVGAGKAGAAMAEAVEEVLGPKRLEEKQVEGLVNVPDATVKPLRAITLHPARAGSENRPTAAGARGTKRMMDLISGLGREDLVICLISGGGSALLPAPAEGLTLGDKVRVTRLLHRAGASIEEMNVVRKHLSALKGGGLARMTAPARLLGLIVSDVVGDPLHAIASGPTVADPTTFADAQAVIRRYGLAARIPDRVRKHLRAGAAGKRPETARRIGDRVTNMVIGNNETALAAAAREARAKGYRVVSLGSRLEGEAKELGTVLASIARGSRDQGRPAPPPLCLLGGGETTVTLTAAPRRPGRGPASPGLGGRNQELALAALVHLGENELHDIAILSGGTDGEDGPTDAAGAVADLAVWRAAKRRRLDPVDHLRRHDAHPFFDAAGGLLRTGPTHTNVMDVQVALVGPVPERS